VTLNGVLGAVFLGELAEHGVGTGSLPAPELPVAEDDPITAWLVLRENAVDERDRAWGEEVSYKSLSFSSGGLVEFKLTLSPESLVQLVVLSDHHHRDGCPHSVDVAVASAPLGEAAVWVGNVHLEQVPNDRQRD